MTDSDAIEPYGTNLNCFRFERIVPLPDLQSVVDMDPLWATVSVPLQVITRLGIRRPVRIEVTPCGDYW